MSQRNGRFGRRSGPIGKSIVAKSGHIISDGYGNLYSTQYGGSKCHCLMCGRKNADGNKNRQSYFAAGIFRDEDGWYYGAASKKHSRKMRRTREKRAWKKEMGDG